ncbi:MAG: calcium-binding protein [Phenylobacterium sp.]
MTTFTFETITAAQALQFTANDLLMFQTGTAMQSSVSYLLNGDVAITVGARTVEFGAAITNVALPFTFASNGSVLFIGGTAADEVSLSGSIPGNAMFGGGGNDVLDLDGMGGLAQGNQGNDTILSQGQATIYGGQGDDSLSATVGADHDFLQGNKGNDTIVGGLHDTLLGGQGDDSITGGGILDGNLGDDRVTGSGQLFGEDGNDTLTTMGLGGDSLTGGNGADHFVFSNGAPSSGFITQILDWSSLDSLQFRAPAAGTTGFTTATASSYQAALTAATGLIQTNHFAHVAVQVGADVIVFSSASGAPDAVDLVGRTLADISAANFI